jgi:hypothetical protein
MMEKSGCGSHAGASHIKPKPTIFPSIPRHKLANNVHDAIAVTSSAVPMPATFAHFEVPTGDI